MRRPRPSRSQRDSFGSASLPGGAGDRSFRRNVTRRPTRLRGRRGPRHAAREHRPPARGGLHIPGGRREPPGVHRPLPQGLAPHARAVRGPRRRRALPPGRPLRPLRHQPRRARPAVPDRRRRPRWQVQPHQDVPRVDAGAERRGHAAGVRLRDRAAAADRPVHRGRQRSPRVVPPQRQQGAPAPAGDPRGEPRSRRAGDHRGIRLTRSVSRLARISLLFLTALAALAAGGCGNKVDTAIMADTEGIYVGVDGLTYQIQISRILNAADREDQAYLRGVSEEPAEDEVWFGVFMRVENEGDREQPAAERFKIVDTQEQEFEPVEIDPELNVFSYQPRPVPAGQLLPEPNAPAYDNTIRGELILFKLPVQSLYNRPLELIIESARGGDNAIVDIDV